MLYMMQSKPKFHINSPDCYRQNQKIWDAIEKYKPRELKNDECLKDKISPMLLGRIIIELERCFGVLLWPETEPFYYLIENFKNFNAVYDAIEAKIQINAKHGT